MHAATLGARGGRLVHGLEPCRLVGHFPTGNPSCPLPPGVWAVAVEGSLLVSVWLARAPSLVCGRVAVVVSGVGWPLAPPAPPLSGGLVYVCGVRVLSYKIRKLWGPWHAMARRDVAP